MRFCVTTSRSVQLTGLRCVNGYARESGNFTAFSRLCSGTGLSGADTPLLPRCSQLQHRPHLTGCEETPLPRPVQRTHAPFPHTGMRSSALTLRKTTRKCTPRRNQLVANLDTTWGYSPPDPPIPTQSGSSLFPENSGRLNPLDERAIAYASRSCERRQRIPASMKSSIAPSNTAPVLPTSCSVRRSLTI